MIGNDIFLLIFLNPWLYKKRFLSFLSRFIYRVMKLTISVFHVLVECCIEKVQTEILRNSPTSDSVGVRQLYGFGENEYWDKSKPSLKSLLSEMVLSKHELKKIFRGPVRINTKYLYDLYIKTKNQNQPIELVRYHEWIYYRFLGYNEITGFLSEMVKSQRLTPKEVILQKDLMNENEVIGNNGKGYFVCYHYSQLWNQIFVFTLIINFDSLKVVNKSSRYEVTAISEMHDLEHQSIMSDGTAHHVGSNLIIDIADSRGGMKKMIFSIEPGPNTIREDSVFLGSYIGVSRNADIISGTICLLKKDEHSELREIPAPIERYLYLDKWQKRIQLAPLGYSLQNIPTPRDEEDILKYLIGKYRFCWLTANSERLVESYFELKNSFEFEIRTFMSENGVYSGRIFVQNNVVCLNSIGLRGNMLGIKLSAAVFLNVDKVLKYQDSDSIDGVYVLSGATSKAKFGYCLLEKIDSSVIITPQIHNQQKLDKSSELQNIVKKLKKLEEGDNKRSHSSDK